MKNGKYDLSLIKDKRVVLLQSGGLDSCYLACLFNYYGFEIHHVFINYGQNSADMELLSAKKIVERYGGNFSAVNIELPWLKDSSFINGHTIKCTLSEENVPLGSVASKIYVPMRNLMFIGIASSYAEAYKIPYIGTGLDGLQDLKGRPLHGTPDKHPNFAIKMEQAIIESSAYHHVDGKDFEILCPIIGNEKFMTIHNGIILNCDFSLSWTCYNHSDKPCLTCDSCLSRLWAFEDLGYEDPLIVKYYGHYKSSDELLKKLGIPIDIKK